MNVNYNSVDRSRSRTVGDDIEWRVASYEKEINENNCPQTDGAKTEEWAVAASVSAKNQQTRSFWGSIANWFSGMLTGNRK